MEAGPRRPWCIMSICGSVFLPSPACHAVCPVGSAVSPLLSRTEGLSKSPRKQAEREDHNLASGPLLGLPGAVSARAESPPLLGLSVEGISFILLDFLPFSPLLPPFLPLSVLGRKFLTPGYLHMFLLPSGTARSSIPWQFLTLHIAGVLRRSRRSGPPQSRLDFIQVSLAHFAE